MSPPSIRDKNKRNKHGAVQITASSMRQKRHSPQWLPPVIAALTIILIWQLSVSIFSVKEYILPSPLQVINELWIQRQSLWSASVTTSIEILAGFGLAVAFSIPAAMFITSFPFVERAFYPLLVVSQTVPKIAIAPLFVVWFGFSMTSKILMAFLLSFFPILVDAIVGLRSISPESHELMRSMGASRRKIMFDLRFPSSLPYLMTGLKVAITLAVVGAVVGEFVGSTKGLGYQLLQANSTLNTKLLFADIVVLTIIGLVLYYLVEIIEKLLIPWHSSVRSNK